MATCIWSLLNELWDDLGDWTDDDSFDAESSISPAGQLYLDCRPLTANGAGSRVLDIGTIGVGDYTVYMRFKGDVWDAGGTTPYCGIRTRINAGSQRLDVIILNNDPQAGGDGIWIYNSASHVKVVTKTWDNDWHTIRFDVHNNQTDVDIYIDDEASPSATDADCSAATTFDDGHVRVGGYGSIAGNGEYHVDFFKINSGNCDPLEIVGGAFLLNMI